MAEPMEELMEKSTSVGVEPPKLPGSFVSSEGDLDGEEGALEICEKDGDQVKEPGSLNAVSQKSKSFD